MTKKAYPATLLPSLFSYDGRLKKADRVFNGEFPDPMQQGNTVIAVRSLHVPVH